MKITKIAQSSRMLFAPLPLLFINFYNHAAIIKIRKLTLVQYSNLNYQRYGCAFH